MASNRQIRRWAQNNGFQLGERGRIPAEVIEAYDNRLAQSDEPVEEVSPEDTGFKQVKKRGRGPQQGFCGFCETGHHSLCPGSVRNGKNAPNPIWFCACSLKDHLV